ncbi:MAG: bifunctional diaminohydroxyphosphoribosylaminopyrimidine deaminase/5-amino-6-(5-phosphoribosylamino)uracil reductase RibD [Spirochaetes bacterium]|nr:bifunctional diaminohydroxyphosphoribosylaminopyrimidine deaminase/5-amino-6-(5-phosphoribosylamino)uracil reductase RibD [Spirochaetota bacterium]
MSENDIKLMQMALDIGFSRLGKTSPNPPVGAVIVKDGEIISCGGTSPYGSDHAEVVAIKNAGRDVTGASIYVSLEPCCHIRKKTPPCTSAIKEAGISKVFIPVLDPNPEVAGRGVETLKEAGIEVIIMTEMSQKAYDLIRHFDKYILKKTPYIIHKSAITLDGKISTKAGDSKWISSDYSRYVTHKLRSVVDAIIIGKNTYNNDDPELSVRIDSFQGDVKDYFKNNNLNISGKESFFLEKLLSLEPENSGTSPLRAVIGDPGKLDFTRKIFRDDNYVFFVSRDSEKTLTEKNGENEIRKMSESGFLVFVEGNSRIDQIKFILEELYKRGKMMVMLEGGGNVAGSFLDAGEIDQFMYFVSPKILGSGTGVISAETKKKISEAHSLYDISSVFLKEDILYNAYSRSMLGLYEEV